MSYTVINTKIDKTSFAFGAKKVITTISLVNMGSGKVGLTYDADYSGMASGHVASDKAIEIDGNKTQKVHNNPEVDVIISNYEKTSVHVLMHIKVTVNYARKHTIFDETLEGNYTAETGWGALFEELKKAETK